MPENRKIIVVSSNVSQHMGGEAIKAFQFIRHLLAEGCDVSLVTHERVAAEVREAFPKLDVQIVRDTALKRALWHGGRLNGAIAAVFNIHARGHIRRILESHPDAVVHYLAPVSPVIPRFPVDGATNVLGPVTGNIYFPKAFAAEEDGAERFRRILHQASQRIFGRAFADKPMFQRILVSGGDRTRASLRWAGATDDQMVDVVDSGVSDSLLDLPLIRHEGINHRFMTSGRLVPHKGVHLTIKALARTREPITFDVFGSGPELDRLKDLARDHNVGERVRFLGWAEDHDALIGGMRAYRGYVVPSLAEANGIVVQEAMMAGLPVICLAWGGPTLLADERSAILVDPASEDHVLDALAAAMDQLALDPDRANALAGNARAIADRRFSWAHVAENWIANYPPAGEPRPLRRGAVGNS